MPSFELIYDEEEDVLEVTFETFDESFARTIALNEKIVIFTDLGSTSAWGITFYSYSKLLQVSETHLDGLRALPEADGRRLLSVAHSRPLSLFLQLVDPADFRSRVLAPGLLALMEA